MSEDKQKLNSFSVIIPTMGRHLAKRAIQSIQNQIYDGDIEIVIVYDPRDMSKKEEFGNMLDELSKQDVRIKVVKLERNMQRVVATNAGLKNATKDWICLLDDDDEYIRTYLYSMNYAINENPDYSIFHFGAIVNKVNITRWRECPEIKEGGPNNEAMERFRSGLLGLGSFIFKREILDETGYLPEGKDLSPYSFADAAKEKYPELIEWYGPKYMEGGKEIGNPWGQDYLLFYMITRKRKSKGLSLMPYIQYVRRGGFHFQDDNLTI